MKPLTNIATIVLAFSLIAGCERKQPTTPTPPKESRSPASASAPAAAQDPGADRPYPVLVTAKTRADARVLAELEKPGAVIFSDGFESGDSFKSSFEVGGLKEGRARITTDAANVRTGKGALQLTAAANDGKSSGAGPSYWFGGAQGIGADKGADGYDRVHIRYSIRFAPDYDQGNLNHTGGGLSGVAGSEKWDGMGGAGERPRGDDEFSSRFEASVDWKHVAPPGFMFCYTYWMDMRIDKDGHYWGNMMEPEEANRFVPERGRWYSMEQMVKVNTIKDGVAQADGELATWIDGTLYTHFTGFRWRSTDAVKVKRAGLSVYVHAATQDNTVWYDDLVISTGYIGPVNTTSPPAPAPAEHKAITTDKLEPYECGTITRLHTLGGVFLASQPKPEDFAQAKKGGVRTVINLRHAAEIKDFDEQKVVEAEGLAYINLPWDGPGELTDEVFDRAREHLKAAQRPILLHCSSANRVGAVWLPYRVLDGGLSWDAALAEAKTVGLKSPDYEAKAKDYIKRHGG